MVLDDDRELVALVTEFLESEGVHSGRGTSRGGQFPERIECLSFFAPAENTKPKTVFTQLNILL